jgi:2-haloacid dehalogenase
MTSPSMPLPQRALDFSRFEALTFDCYGTLINWEEGILGCLRPMLAAHAKDIDDAMILKLFGDFEANAEKGIYQRYRAVLESVVRDFGKHLAFKPTTEEASSLPNSLANWKPWPDTVKALHELKRRFQLCIISNVDDDLFATTRPKLEVSFDQVVTAQQAQAYKPSLKIFELALSRVGIPAHRILHVGQSVYHDVIPAQSLGLATVWVNRPSIRAGVGAVRAAEGNPDLRVTSLAELAEAARR